MLDSQYAQTVQTTGYTWDGDIQEFNHLIPRIWLGGFYATIVFAFCYWFLYPAWPTGETYTKGILNRVSYQSQGSIIRTHWNSRALLLYTLQKNNHTERQQEYLQRLASISFKEIVENAELMIFIKSLAKRLFNDNCVPCHGENFSLSTNIANVSQTQDGAFERVEQYITHSHKFKEGLFSLDDRIPSSVWKNRLSFAEIKALTIYVQQLR
ncbi:hypothetical protein CCP3SC5AM1_460008 [Gammaproteobacteria bacterium]